MPHAVFDKKINLTEFSSHFKKLMQKESELIKLEDVYVNKETWSALIPAVVIDEQHQNFLIEISTTEQKTTVRLYPGTDPIKTKGVKKAMGFVAKMIQDTNPDAKIIRTNIGDFIPTKPNCQISN